MASLRIRHEQLIRRDFHPLDCSLVGCSGIRQYAEIAAHANVNLMENVFDQGKLDASWDRMNSFKEESKIEDFDMLRYLWESRMNYLATQILLDRKDIDQAEVFIHQNLGKVRDQHTKKREGGFLRILGEVKIRRNEYENAINNISKAITILKEVGNPRQLWQAYGSLATAFNKQERFSEARERWGAAAEIIHKTAGGLSNRELREGFLKANQIREILSKAES